MIVAYTALHYGREYLASAIRSMRNYVDAWYMLYTPEGSHGHKSRAICPETEDELYTIASRLLGSKLHWHSGIWVHEGQQRDTIYSLVPEAEVVVAVDADEIWGTGLFPQALHHTRRLGHRNIRLPMWHYWRSFKKAVISDPALPIRIVYPAYAAGDFTYRGTSIIHHFGYAQSEAITRYKIEVHGHKNEWRGEWFTERFLPNAQTDCHPVSRDHWNPVDIDPDVLPQHMRLHPYYDLAVIK